MLVVDPTRPTASQGMAQRFRLADSSVGREDNLLDQIVFRLLSI
jgi:hypothetical protein